MYVYVHYTCIYNGHKCYRFMRLCLYGPSLMFSPSFSQAVGYSAWGGGGGRGNIIPVWPIYTYTHKQYNHNEKVFSVLHSAKDVGLIDIKTCVIFAS
jgi:hypothetical protein